MGLKQPTMWEVYEYLRQRFMRAGDIPNRNEVLKEFPGIDPVEADAGIIHFYEIIKGWPAHA